MTQIITMFMLYIFEAIVVYQYAGTIFYKKNDSWKIYISFFAGYSVLYGVSFLNLPVLNMLLFVLSNFLILFFNYESRLRSALFHAVMVSMIMFISEIIIVMLFSHLMDATQSSETSLFVLDAVISKLLFFILSKVIAQITVKETLEDNFSEKILGLYILPVSSFVILIEIFFLSQRIKFPIEYYTEILIGSILLLFANITVFNIYENQLKTSRELTALKLANQKNEIDMEYYQILQGQYENSRILVHDIKNHITTIDALASTNDTEKIKSYISSISDHYSLYNPVPITENKMLDVICSQKYAQCSLLDIDLSINNEGVRLDFINDVDLCTIMTNLLDNAIESCKASAEKKIELSFYYKNSAFVVINMKNSCDKSPVIINHQFMTTKSDKVNHGVGMVSIQRAIEKYDGSMDCYYDEENHIFHSNIIFNN